MSKDLTTLIQSSHYYTGIGSRSTPTPILKLIEDISQRLAQKGLILRSGGANGADHAFEEGCNKSHGKKEIFLPWRGFNSNNSKLFLSSHEALKIASKIHPNWKNCSPAARKLHSRNIHQVLGKDLKQPSNFVIFYAPIKQGKIIGGTATATTLAKDINIPIFNLFEPEIQNLWSTYLKKDTNKTKLPKDTIAKIEV